MGVSASQVASHLLSLAAQEPEPEFVTHLRLQKLLYYVQGWSLALRGRAMFAGAVEAWNHGPVVREIYARFADFGANPIPAHMAGQGDALPEDDARFVAGVWRHYRRFSASQLRRMTHSESPWKDARRGVPDGQASTAPISEESMRRFFERAYARQPGAMFPLEDWRLARENERAGRGLSLQDAFERARRALPGHG